jgi:hypothetical protein
LIYKQRGKQTGKQVSKEETIATDHIPGDPVREYLRSCERLAIDGTALVPAQPVPDASIAEAMSISATEKEKRIRGKRG